MTKPQWRSQRGWAAAACLGLAWVCLPLLEGVLYDPVAHVLRLHMIAHGTMRMAPYAWLMGVRLLLDLGLFVTVGLILGRPVLGFPLRDRRGLQRLGAGVGAGLLVMAAAILCIVLGGAARVSAPAQSVPDAVGHGGGWLAFDLLGATGEELYGRGAVLLVAAALFGPRGAMAASGATFVLLHLGNPGASPLWLARLFLQGVLLAYAVYRTGSLWWSVGYHAGWNWASAPLFGAAGSGFLDEGHLFDFHPTGPALLTGGAVGPEGSVYAFAAVLAAWGLLVATTRAGDAARAPDRV